MGSFSNYSGTTLTGGSYVVTGTGTFDFGGANIQTNAATIVLDGPSSMIANTSNVNALTDLATNTASGQLTIQDGATLTSPAGLSNAGGITVGQGSSLDVSGNYTQTGGSTTVNGTLDAGSNAVGIQGGTLAGSGTVIGEVTSSGAVTPGDSGPGILTVTGNYTQTAAGALTVNIEGLTVGTQYGQLAVSGIATLDGTLNIDLLNGYAPNTGDTFSLVTYSSFTGSFATVNGTSLGIHQLFETDYLTGGVDLIDVLAAINVTPSTGLTTTQAGGTAQFSVVLAAQPTADVTIGLYSSDTSLGTISTSSLTFTPDDWNAAQTVTITGVNDGSLGANEPYTIVTEPAVSDDPNFNGVDSSDVQVTNLVTDQRDLQVLNLAVSPGSGIQSGTSVTVTWDDADVGNVAVTNSFTDAIAITDLTTGQTLATATIPYDETSLGPIAGGSEAAQQYSFTLPPGPDGAGNIQVSVTTNSGGQVLERNDSGTASSNNTTTLTVSSALAAPDLQVTGLETNPASGLLSGSDVVVEWSDTNTGNLPALGSFDDLVTMTNTTTGQTLATATVTYDANANGNLGAGQSFAQQYTFQLPDGPAGVGQMQFTVQTDSSNNIPEYNDSGTGENNNTSSITVASSLAPYPDLQVTGLSMAPSSLQSGDSVTVTWNDANTGNAPVTGSFYDDVTVVNTTTDETIASGLVYYDEASQGPIAANGSAAEQYGFVLPNGTPGVGQIEVTVTTDYYNNIYEYNSSGTGETNNTSSITETSTIAPYPDLLVSAISLSPSSGLVSGDDLIIDWTDANDGNAPTPGGWTDEVVVVNATTGQTLLDQYVLYDPSAPGNGAIAPGDSRDLSTSFTLPRGLAGVGDLQVRIITNAYASFYEWNSAGTGETNNTATAAITSTLAPCAGPSGHRPDGQPDDPGVRRPSHGQLE